MKSLPIWAERLLRAICPEELFEQIEGDLMEIYNNDVKIVGERKAKLKFVLTAVRFFRPGILLRNKFSFDLRQMPMFQNYLKTTYRHLLKSKLNFCFKIGGLSVALLSFLVIAIYVSYQLSFDRYHHDYENVYRVNSSWKENGAFAKYAIVPPAVGPALKDHFPEVRSFARLQPSSQSQVQYKEKSFQLWGFVAADSSVFDVLTFEFLSGDRHALDHARSIVLTRTMAKQIFGNVDPMLKSISFTDRFNETYVVTAVIEDLPPNSHLYLKALMPFNSLRDSMELAMDPWAISIDGSAELYVRLHESANANDLAAKAIPVLRENISDEEGHKGNAYAISLQSIADIYLSPSIYAEYCGKGNITYLYVFALLGIFLLVIAGINYVNLSIADFHNRSKEIGIRKVMGARKKQIAFHVVAEAFLVCVAALLLSIGFLYFFFPYVLQRLDGNLRVSMLLDPKVLSSLSVSVVLLVIFSMAYPAYHLSVNNPIQDLKPGPVFRGNAFIGNGLLFVQCVISVICITASFVVARQMELINTRNPGYDRQNLIVVYMPDRYPTEKIPVLKEELKKLPGVETASYSAFRIAGGGIYRNWYRIEINGEMKPIMLNEVFFDHDFFKASGIQLLEGRSFEEGRPSDSHAAFIVNETAVREFGWIDPIGKRISHGYEDTDGEKWEGTVVGVVQDFNVYSFHRKIEPLVMRLPWSDWPGNCIHIKIRGPLDQTITAIKNKYEEIFPGFLLNYSVIEDIYDNQYQAERKTFTTLQMTTWIVVLISSIGVFSLSVYLSLKKMKEFGIRKVLGATASQIIVLHVSHFIKIVFIANLIALPVAWWLMNEWLSEFAYRTGLNGTVFFNVAIISFLMVVISSAYASYKAAIMNPIEVIKTE